MSFDNKDVIKNFKKEFKEKIRKYFGINYNRKSKLLLKISILEEYILFIDEFFSYPNILDISLLKEVNDFTIGMNSNKEIVSVELDDFLNNCFSKIINRILQYDKLYKLNPQNKYKFTDLLKKYTYSLTNKNNPIWDDTFSFFLDTFDFLNLLNSSKDDFETYNRRLSILLSKYSEKLTNIDNLFIKDSDFTLNKTKKEINYLNKKLKDLENKSLNNEKELASEREEKERILYELEEKDKLLKAQLKNEREEKEKDIEKNKILKAIEKLNTNSYELNEERKKFIENRDNFKSYALDIFKITIFIFVFMTFYLHFFSDINNLNKEISIGYYLIHSFPILFPTLIGFLFLRQSNINAKELNKINRRFTLTHDIRASLEALVEINSPDKMHDKAEKVIDKLIDNILDYANENNQTENEKIDVLEFNEKLDKIIDTLDKKKTVFNVLNK